MNEYRGYPTLDEDWERFYREFPDVYDRFALSSREAVRVLDDLVGFGDADVLVVAAGTGVDAVEIARRARRVVATDPSPEMRSVAAARARTLARSNVEIRDGTAEDLRAFGDAEFDRVVSVHGAPFLWDADHCAIRESLRVLRPGGHVAFVTTTPGWHKPHDDRAVEPARAELDEAGARQAAFGFSPVDFLVELDYGSVDEALATWGFIYGARAIDYLLERGTSRLCWSLRVWHRGA